MTYIYIIKTNNEDMDEIPSSHIVDIFYIICLQRLKRTDYQDEKKNLPTWLCIIQPLAQPIHI